MTQQTIVCVAGMHRSGTSLTARLLALLGAYLGPQEDLVAPASDNPSGFWEYRPIVEMNAEILRRAGGRAFAPPVFEQGWEKSAELEDLRTRAKELIQRTFANADFWAWKDPRTCLTLPFWQMVASPTHCLICVRNPADVARSIERRDGVLLERSLYLWLTYTRAAIAGSATRCRTLIDYDAIMDDPLKQIAELAQFIGMPERSEDPEILERVTEFVDGRLRHHQISTSSHATSVAPSSSAGSLALSLRAYRALLDHGLTEGHDIDSLFEEALAAVPQWAIPKLSAGVAISENGADEPSGFPWVTPMREDRPIVSIIVNNYNYARFLREAIDSALAQTYKTEIVVVDDGSTDDSRLVIESYGDRIHPVFKENGGQASAFNSGFNASGGEIVIFLDSDDVLLPTAAEKAVQLFKSGVVKVHWPLWEINTDGNRTGVIHPRKSLGEGNLRERTLIEGPLAGNSPPTSGNAWSRGFLERVMPAPETEFRICADGYLVTLAWIYGEVRAIQEPLGLYRVHGRNQFAAKSAQQQMERHLEKFVHHCTALEAHLRAMGENPQPGIWKRWKGLYDSQVEGAAKTQLLSLLRKRARTILVDDGAWPELFSTAGEPSLLVPFVERDGKYWGRPADDAAAIAELERLRRAGSDLLVVPWFSFWWLDYYLVFAKYLYEQFPCEWTEFFAVFDLGWAKHRDMFANDLVDILPLGAHYLLVDEGMWSGSGRDGVAVAPNRRATPFLECDGEYWGRPSNDASAINEMELARKGGAQFIVFPWFTFWWLEHYTEFNLYMRQRFPLVLATDTVVVFDLREIVPGLAS